MPKKGPRSSVTRVSGRVLWVVASSSNVATVNLTPDNSVGLGQFGAKLSQISDAFALCRFTALSFEVSANGTIAPADSTVTVGYTPEVTTSAPATASNHIDLPFSFHRNLRATDTIVRHVPSKLLRSTGVPWFRTRMSGSYDDNLESQGVISQRTPGATDSLVMVVHYTIEFKDFIGPSQTPMSLVPAPSCTRAGGDDRKLALSVSEKVGVNVVDKSVHSVEDCGHSSCAHCRSLPQTGSCTAAKFF